MQSNLKLVSYYSNKPETTRLTESKTGQLELTRTRDILSDNLPTPPAVVIDVGGGTGVHASWLAEKGYKVTLIDPVPSQINIAKSNTTYTSMVGDARKLDLQDNSADAVLLLGPLYHLDKKEDRLLAISEARRVLKPNGVLIAAAISRFAGLMDFGSTGRLTPEVVANWNETLKTGVHNTDNGFTDAYFHLPEEFKTEVESAGIKNVRLSGIEGPCWIIARDDVSSEGYEAVLLCARTLANDLDLIAASSHFMAIGTK
jgi:ubiquinone/menaquinone biosynthesis C-methylase UbiE